MRLFFGIVCAKDDAYKYPNKERYDRRYRCHNKPKVYVSHQTYHQRSERSKSAARPASTCGIVCLRSLSRTPLMAASHARVHCFVFTYSPSRKPDRASYNQTSSGLASAETFGSSGDIA